MVNRSDLSETAMSERYPELDQLRHWRVAAPRGRLIYDENEVPEAFYRVETGCVRLQVNSDDGRRQILAFCLPGDVFGIELDGLRMAAAEVAATAELTRYPLMTIRTADPGAGSLPALLGAASDMVASLSMHLKGLAHASAEDRLLWFLDWLARRQGVELSGGVLQTPMNRRDIADFLGLAQETLSRTFARLVNRRMIRVMDSRHVQLRPRPAAPLASENGLRSAA